MMTNRGLEEEIKRLNDQLRAMNKVVSDLQTSQSALTNQVAAATANPITPPLINLLNNSDFTFNNTGYIGASYGGDDDCAEWYVRESSNNAAIYDLNTPIHQSTDVLTYTGYQTQSDGVMDNNVTANLNSVSAVFSAGDVGSYAVVEGAGASGAYLFTKVTAFVDANNITLSLKNTSGGSITAKTFYIFDKTSQWDKIQGVTMIGGSSIDSLDCGALGTVLDKNFALPGSLLYIRFIVKKQPYATITGSHKLRVTIWDNTSGPISIIEGQTLTLTVNSNTAGAGAYTREYILKIETPGSSFFYSNITSPLSVAAISNTDSVTPGKYIEVGWSAFTEALRYKLYRRTKNGVTVTDDWRQIAEITNGATSFRDVGGQSGSIYTIPAANINPKAMSLVTNFGSNIGDNFRDILVAIRIPSSYNFGATTGTQLLRVDIVDSNYDGSSDSNYVVLEPGSLVFDRMAMSFNNGKWNFSARDITSTGAFVSTSPIPVGMGGGGGGLGKDNLIDGSNLPFHSPFDGDGLFLGEYLT